MSISERFKKITETKKQSQKAWARDLGTNDSTLISILKGRTNPSATILLPLVELGYNANWLLTGRGDMYAEEENLYSPPIDSDTLMTPSSRIKLIIDTHYNGVPTELAKALDVSKTAIFSIIKKGTTPSGAIAIPLIKLGYSLNWLYEGKGPMLVDDIPEPDLPPEVVAVMRQHEEAHEELQALKKLVDTQGAKIEELEGVVRTQAEALAFYRAKYPTPETQSVKK